MTYQGSPPPRPVPRFGYSGRPGPDEPAEPGPGYGNAVQSGHPQLPPVGGDGMAARPQRRVGAAYARLGRGSPWFWSAIGLAVVGAVVVVVALAVGGSGSAAGSAPGALVTTFLPNEVQRVPSACTAVPAAVLDQYLPGRSKPAAAQPLEGKAASQCSWAVDRRQEYRFMEVLIEAYAPSGLASGNGSASQAAQDAFVSVRVARQFPPRQSRQPKAKITGITGLGQQAFAASQHYNRGAVLDMETVVVRDRNVLVTVIFEARVGGRYGGDPVATLQAGALAAARSALAKVG